MISIKPHKKILFVIDSLGCGGAEKSLVSLLPLLNSFKYKIYLWIRTRGGVFEEYIPNNVTVIDQPQYIFFEKLIIKLFHWAYSLCYAIDSILILILKNIQQKPYGNVQAD